MTEILIALGLLALCAGTLIYIGTRHNNDDDDHWPPRGMA